MKQGMRLALEAGPLAAFFVANQMFGLYVGAGVLMAATVVALTANWSLERKLPVMPLVGCAFVLVFGGLTLALDDTTFIKLKPTVANLFFAAALFGGMALRRPILKIVLGSTIELQDEGWRILTLRFALFFLALAALNEFVWRNFSDDIWANFKVFGLMPLTLLFGALQTPVILRHQIVAEDGSASS